MIQPATEPIIDQVRPVALENMTARANLPALRLSPDPGAWTRRRSTPSLRGEMCRTCARRCSTRSRVFRFATNIY